MEFLEWLSNLTQYENHLKGLLKQMCGYVPRISDSVDLKQKAPDLYFLTGSLATVMMSPNDVLRATAFNKQQDHSISFISSMGTKT